MKERSVALIINFDFGADLLRIASLMPVWIVSSLENDGMCDRAYKSSAKNISITKVFIKDHESIEDIFYRVIYEIEDHHGVNSSLDPYEVVYVYGLSEDVIDIALISDLDFIRCEPTNFGFKLLKN